MKEIYGEAEYQWNKELKNLRIFWRILAISFWVVTIGIVWSICKFIRFIFIK